MLNEKLNKFEVIEKSIISDVFKRPSIAHEVMSIYRKHIETENCVKFNLYLLRSATCY